MLDRPKRRGGMGVSSGSESLVSLRARIARISSVKGAWWLQIAGYRGRGCYLSKGGVHGVVIVRGTGLRRYFLGKEC